jgi:hypothetical protein
VPRHAPHRKELRERVDHVFARDAAVHLQGQALPRVLVLDREPLQWAAAGGPIETELLPAGSR